MAAKFTHRDCRNFAPVDVAKGICHLTKQLVLADEECCPKFEKLPKCAHCKNFKETEEFLGVCEASPDKFMAYPDMTAVTCDMFAWRDSK